MVESQPSPEEEQDEITPEQIFEAAKDYLAPEDLTDMEGMDANEVFNNVATVLECQGVNWEDLFRKHGLIE